MNIKFVHGVTVDFKSDNTDVDAKHFSRGEVVENVVVERDGKFSDIHLEHGVAFGVSNSAFVVLE